MAGFNIQEFSNKINQYGTLQNNKFIVTINKPQIFQSSTLDQLFQFRASSVKIPGVTLDVTPTFRYGVGPALKMPKNVLFNDISITFIEMEDAYIWKTFSLWINEIFDFSDRGLSSYKYTTQYKQYYASPTIEIAIYSNDGELANTIVFKEAYPTSLADVNVSWSENTLMNINVTFTFKEWYVEGIEMVPIFNSGVRPVEGPTGVRPVTPPPQPRLELDPRADTSTNPYAPSVDPLTLPNGMNFRHF